ncbi:MAG: hypothetical protein H0V17_25790 [Deltaproteobacteria bacterium]|nr:hypothetical protein [Deltaproteobacteria bacterium]
MSSKRPPEQTSEGNWAISLKDLDQEKPNLTVELQTADLKELAIPEGMIQAMTQELSTLDLVEIRPGNTVAEINRSVAGESSTVIVDLGEEPPRLVPVPPVASQVMAPIPIQLQSPSTARWTPASVATRAATDDDRGDDSGGNWLVVVVYLIAATALGISIYLRFFA